MHIFFSTMEDFPTVHYAFAIEAYFSHNYSYIAVVHEYRNHFNLVSSEHVPSRKTLLMSVKNFRDMAVASKKPAWPYTYGSYIWKCGTSATSSWSGTHSYCAKASTCIRNKRLVGKTNIASRPSLPPLQNLVTPELKQTDYKQRRMFARRMLTNIEVGEILLQYLLMSDEANFHLDGGMNKQNYRYWSPYHPHEVHQRGLHSPRVTVWHGMTEFGIIGP